MEGPPLGPGGEDITWPDQVAPRGRKASSTRKIKPQTSNLVFLPFPSFLTMQLEPPRTVPCTALAWIGGPVVQGIYTKAIHVCRALLLHSDR